MKQKIKKFFDKILEKLLPWLVLLLVLAICGGGLFGIHKCVDEAVKRHKVNAEINTTKSLTKPKIIGTLPDGRIVYRVEVHDNTTHYIYFTDSSITKNTDSAENTPNQPETFIK